MGVLYVTREGDSTYAFCVLAHLFLGGIAGRAWIQIDASPLVSVRHIFELPWIDDKLNWQQQLVVYENILYLQLITVAVPDDCLELPSATLNSKDSWR